VAAELDLSTSAVFNAKSCILGRIRELMPRIEDSW
jgi:hypothetical protein